MTQITVTPQKLEGALRQLRGEIWTASGARAAQQCQAIDDVLADAASMARLAAILTEAYNPTDFWAVA